MFIASVVLSLLLVYNQGFVNGEHPEAGIREKKDISTVTDFASSLLGGKFKRGHSNINDWDYRSYPSYQTPFGSPGRYQGSFGGTYVSTYQRNPGGYIYDRPQVGGPWQKPGYPSFDDTVVVYPTGGGGTFFSAPSASGVITPAVQSSYTTSSLCSSCLPVSITPGQAVRQPAVPAIASYSYRGSVLPEAPPRSFISSPPTGPAFQGSIPVSGPAISSVYGGPVIPQRPQVIAQPPVVLSKPALAFTPTATYGPASPPLVPQPTSRFEPSSDGYNYDKPDVPFF